MICFHTEFHMPDYNSSLIIIMKSKSKCVIHAATILLPYILQKKTQAKVAYSSKICYHAQFQNPAVSVANFAPISEAWPSLMLVLLTVRNEKQMYAFGGASNSVISILNFIRIHPKYLELRHADKHGFTSSTPCKE
jgi:hypothetical protein